MPQALPTNPLDLIDWAAGAPRPDSDPAAGGLDLWWDHYREAKHFFLVCPTHYLLAVGINSQRPMNRLSTVARDFIRDSHAGRWRAVLDSDHWNSLAPARITEAWQEEPLCLVKALTVAVIVEHYLSSIGYDTTDYYNRIHIKPAIYCVQRDDGTRLHSLGLGNRTNIINEIARLGQLNPQNVLTGHDEGMFVSFDVAQAIVAGAGIPGLAIKYATRAANRGVSPAAPKLTYVCPGAAAGGWPVRLDGIQDAA